MQELLFQNNLIVWTSPWIVSLSLSIGIFVSLIAWMTWRYYKKNKKKIIIPQAYRSIKEDHPDYISHTLLALKQYLMERNTSEHVPSHTAIEIARYNHNLLNDIIRELEN